MKSFDLFVIGGGPAGYVAAIKASRLGKTVALAEMHEVGGTCLNRGCVPTKTLLHSAELFREISANAENLGIDAATPCVNARRLSERRDEVVGQMRSGVQQLLKTSGVIVITGRASIGKNKTVHISGEEYSADNILIATGSKVSVPPIPGCQLPGVVTSDDLLEGEMRIPESLAVIGGGVIGVEMASVYSAFGCRVTVLEGMPQILPSLDDELSRSVAMVLKKRGVTVVAGASVSSVEKSDGGLSVKYESKGKTEECFAELVLVATGRKPDTEGLFDGDIQVKTERGGICVDSAFMTSEPGIYAVGDVIAGSVQLAHAASAQAVNCVLTMFGEKPEHDLSAIPACIYTSPEIAVVGLSEQQAKQQELSVKAGRFSTLSNARSVIAYAERGFVKLLFDARSEKLLGAAVMSERATDMIGEAVTAIACGLTREQLSLGVRAHPTFGEAFGEAALDAGDGAIHAVVRRKR